MHYYPYYFNGRCPSCGRCSSCGGYSQPNMQPYYQGAWGGMQQQSGNAQSGMGGVNYQGGSQLAGLNNFGCASSNQ